MPRSKIKKLSSFLPALLSLCAIIPAALGQQNQQQQKPQQPPAQADVDVVRVNTELVQTDVMVFDRQGKFVDNLTRDQFELKVDGKLQPISFFERVKAGTVDEEAQIAAARGGSSSRTSAAGVVRPLDRGRSVLFFVDDLHLSPSSVVTTRKTLLHFINDELGQNDEAAVASASGQIGFLQQMTGERAVLRAAVARLSSKPYQVRDFERPPMTEYQAIVIDRNQRDVLDYFVEQLLRENPLMSRQTAEQQVMTRAHNILQQAAAISRNTLFSLESLVRTSAEMPGRKLVFFISDGFFIEDHESGVMEQLRKITDAAARSGVVIYTLDARGLATNPSFNAAEQSASDPGGRLARTSANELSSTQEVFHTLAADTGGRALLNSNSPERMLTNALEESSVYYLLAWQPEHAEQHNAKFKRIEIKLLNHPDMNVVVRRGFFDSPPDQPNKNKTKSNQPAPSADDEIMSALRSSSRRTALPTSLFLGYADVPGEGLALNAATQVEGSTLDFQKVEGKLAAGADLVGAVYDDQGKFLSGFKHLISVTTSAQAAPTERTPIVYVHKFRLTPGLYQVRVATRDVRTGRLGNATQWIEIPDLSQGQLSLSSIFVGERTEGQAETSQSASPQDVITTSADRRFWRSSWLRFLIFVYNAKRAQTPPDLAIQVQVFRDDQPVVTDTLRKINTDSNTDMAHVPYAADLPLENLPAGQYVLQLTVIDRVSRSSASQRVGFYIE